jgi:tetratricopeptide (TPR) repeat protein
LEIDPDLAEPHTSFGWIRMTYYHDWKAAEGEYKRAIALNPNYAMVHLWYSGLLEWQGRVEEAGSERQRAQELDPLSLSNNAFSGRSSLYARNYERAVEQCQTVLAMDPDYALAYVHLGRAYIQLARYIEGIRAFEKVIDLNGRVSESIAWLGFAYARAGRSAEARKLLVELEEQSTKNYVSSFDRALLYTGLGEKDRAFELLAKAVDERLAGVLSLKVNPEFDPLRSDPRFRELVRTIGLPPG